MFSFPNPVNEVAARLVAGGVVLLSLLIVVFDLRWLTVALAYGFVARVLAGPRFSPLGLLATKVLVPRLPFEAKLVPGPPKRFAQGIGAAFSVTAAALALGFDAWGAAQVLLGLLIVAASLEAFAGFCVGCAVFGALMRGGLVPDEVCERCNDIWARPHATTAS